MSCSTLETLGFRHGSADGCCELGSNDLGPGPKKPNILVIMGDDIGIWNVSGLSPGDDWDTTRPISIASPKTGGKFHDLLRTAELHSRSLRVHYRPAAVSHRPE